MAEDGSNVLYSVYLDDTLLSENLDQYEYPLSDLTPETDYHLEVVAANGNLTNKRTLDFTTSSLDETLPPRDFEISVDSITSISAFIKWTSAKSSDDEVLHDVYLNDSLLVADLDQLEFSLNSLTQETNYAAKILARNIYGTAEASIDFMTTENPNLLLSAYDYNNQYWKVEITYNNSGQMKKKSLFENYNPTNPSEYMGLRYEYNPEGVLTQERYYNYSVYGEVNYYYNGNNLNKITDEIGNENQQTNTYEFNADLTYYSDVYTDYDSYFGTTTVLHEYENFVTYTNNEFISSIITKDLDDNLISNFTFEYSNGNIIEIKDIINNDLFEISYDNHPNFSTYIMGIRSIREENILGLPFTQIFWTELQNMPLFYKFNNVNNPVEYKFNGQVVKTLRYNYNQYGYPIGINIGPSPSTQVHLEYIANP